MDKFVILYFQLGLYTVDQFKEFVKAGWITKEQFKETSGQDYDNSTKVESVEETKPVKEVEA